MRIDTSEHVHEAKILALDSSKAKKSLGWHPKLTAELAVEKTSEWYKMAFHEKNMLEFTTRQIDEFIQN